MDPDSNLKGFDMNCATLNHVQCATITDIPNITDWEQGRRSWDSIEINPPVARGPLFWGVCTSVHEVEPYMESPRFWKHSHICKKGR